MRYAARIMRHYDGTTSTVTYHDPTADANVSRPAEARAEAINAEYAAATSTVLRENTLFKGHQVAGLIYFSKPKTLKDKKAVLAEIDVPIGGKVYRFQ
jgi:hypothetical protein